MNTEKIPRRILGTLLSSASAGVVPRSGAPYIAIGRVDEIEAMTEDMRRVEGGEGVTRFIIGRYGSGKSFLIQLMRGYAAERGFVTADCDLSPERRLCGTGGLATYRELIRNLSCKSSPDGGALPVIIGKWYSSVSERLISEGVSAGDENFASLVTARIVADARILEAGVGGFDFALIVSEYCKAYGDGDDEKMSACLRWLRGEYGNKTEARRATGLRSVSVIDDSNWYDNIKLIAALVRHVGYSGLCIFIDEGVNLYKIPNRISREANYEKILSMYNDTMQGRAGGMMLVFGGTPQFLEDSRRGLFSYEALRSRLSDGRFAHAAEGSDGSPLKSMMGPVIRLRRLSDVELLALIRRLTSLHGRYYSWEVRISEDEMTEFLRSSLSRAGAESMITPREIIRDYVTLLDLLYQNPDKSYKEIMPSIGNHENITQSSEESKNGVGNSSDKITIDDIVL
ncbi:MAG: DUF2791 family P-loop domain-containing protein [Clostridiales bacterium]|nr:DUF2791 family P-loop domain-containing protein [Clostridiales bacterium]